ncbi:MAG: hypothetical protein MJ227_00060 [Bacilli bacterium]|nr:hypothetical protein [Bacilli bacterium]
MKKNPIFKLIAPSIAAIIACGTAAVGATYALFTSKAESNVIITAGKVKVESRIENFQTYSGKWNDTTSSYDIVPTEELGKFSVGGTATLSDGTLTLDRIVPMDKVEFDLVTKNLSNVEVKGRYIYQVTEDDGLFAGLNVTLDGQKFDGITKYTKWDTLPTGEKTVHVVAELPNTDDDGSNDNKYQEKTCSMKFSIEAVQGNAHVVDVPEGFVTIYNANDYKLFSKYATQGLLMDADVVLMNDIDLQNELMSPITKFTGTFDGNGKTISNVNIKGEKKVGLFGELTSRGTVKNLTVNGAKVEGINAVGTIAGLVYYADVEGCTVKNAEVISKVKNNDDGDKVGAVVGRLSVEEGTGSVKNCAALDSKVTGYRQVGSVLGGAYKTSGSYDISGNTAKNINILCDMTENPEGYSDMKDVRPVVGNVEYDPSAAENVVINKIQPVVVNPGQSVKEAVSSALANSVPGDKLVLPEVEGLITLPNLKNGITLDGNGNRVDTSEGMLAPNNATIKNLSFEKIGNTNYHGFTNDGLFENCVFDGRLTTYGLQKFVNCTFNMAVYDYNIWAYGNAEFVGCTFNGLGKALKIYNESSNPSQTISVLVKDCVFNAPVDNTNNKPAIAIDSRGCMYNVTILNAEVNNFAVAQDTAMANWWVRISGASDYIKMLVGAENTISTVSVSVDGVMY